MVATIGLGLSEVFERFPVIHQMLRYGGAAYLLYLAYRIATATPVRPDAAQPAGRPLTFRAGRTLPMGQSEGLDDGGGRHQHLHDGRRSHAGVDR